MEEIYKQDETLLGKLVRVEAKKFVEIGVWYGYDQTSLWFIIGHDRVSVDKDDIITIELVD